MYHSQPERLNTSALLQNSWKADVTQENNPTLCNIQVSSRLNACLMYYTGVSDESQLQNIDYAQAFSSFLLSHGMSQQQLDALVYVLTTPM